MLKYLIIKHLIRIFITLKLIHSTPIFMKNVLVMDGEIYLNTIEKKPELISQEDIQKNIKLQREVVAKLCGEKWYDDELCVI
jgi:hypothetical protein